MLRWIGHLHTSMAWGANYAWKYQCDKHQCDETIAAETGKPNPEWQGFCITWRIPFYVMHLTLAHSKLWDCEVLRSFWRVLAFVWLFSAAKPNDLPQGLSSPLMPWFSSVSFWGLHPIQLPFIFAVRTPGAEKLWSQVHKSRQYNTAFISHGVWAF